MIQDIANTHVKQWDNKWQIKKPIKQLKIKDWKDLHKIMLNNKLESSTSTLYI